MYLVVITTVIWIAKRSCENQRNAAIYSVAKMMVLRNVSCVGENSRFIFITADVVFIHFKSVAIQI